MSSTAIQASGQAAPAKVESTHWRRPVYRVIENADDFNVRVEMPGVNREALEISIKEEILRITGTRVEPVSQEWKPLRRELPRGDFRLDLRLNVSVNEAKIKAKVADGVLDLTLPKADEVKPRKIKVS